MIKSLHGRSWLLFAALMLGHLSQGLTFTAFAPALPQMARDFGGGSYGAMTAQLTLVISALGMMIGALASGWIVERTRPRTLQLIALASYGVLGAGGLFLRQASLLLVSRFAVGFVCACLVTTSISLIASHYEGHARARVLGVSGAMASGISLVAMLVGGALAKYGGWRLAFVQYPIFALVGFSIVAAAPPLTTGAQVPMGARIRFAGQSFLRRLWPLYAITVVLAGVMFMGSTQFSFMLEQDGVRDPVTRSLIMSAVTLIAVLIGLLYGSIQRRLGQLPTLVFGLMSMSFALALVGQSSSPQLAAIAAAFMGVFIGITIPFLHHYVTEHSSAQERSRAVGVLNAFNFLGGFLNPLVFVPLAAVWGLRNVFLMAAAGMLIIGGGVLAVIRSRAGERVPR
jgi:MFS family permease